MKKKKKKGKKENYLQLVENEFQGNKQISVSGLIYSVRNWKLKKRETTLGGAGEVSKKSLQNVGGRISHPP